MGFPETTGETLYALVMSNPEFKSKAEAVAKNPAEKRYKLAGKSDINDPAILDIIFDAKNDVVRKKILGPIDRKAFENHIKNCIPKVKEKDVQELLVYKSFPETYFHPILADALAASGKLTKAGEELASRIAATGMYLFLYKDARFLSTALMVGLSHSISRSMYGGGKYTEETVAYTLLTFSYFGAKKLGIADPDWFFYWKVFGSLMGLPVSLLPNDYNSAKAIMGNIHKSSCYPAKPLTKNQEALLSAFLETFKEDGVMDIYITNKDKPEFSDLCSSRMAEYLKAKGLVGSNKKEAKGK